jgi:hypothetical protein
MPAVRYSEKMWQQSVIDLAHMLGWISYHTHDSRRSNPGFPDLVLLRPPRIIYAELKVGKNKTSKAQDRWLDMLAACPGNEVAVWYPSQLDEVAALLGRNYRIVTPDAHRCVPCDIEFTTGAESEAHSLGVHRKAAS